MTLVTLLSFKWMVQNAGIPWFRGVSRMSLAFISPLLTPSFYRVHCNPEDNGTNVAGLGAHLFLCPDSLSALQSQKHVYPAEVTQLVHYPILTSVVGEAGIILLGSRMWKFGPIKRLFGLPRTLIETILDTWELLRFLWKLQHFCFQGWTVSKF